ncbi:MAG: alpha/beta fold hydrolase [Planctomycetales bacterium]
MKFQLGSVAAILAVAAIAWLLLGLWTPDQAVRTYVVIPPVGLLIFLALARRTADGKERTWREMGWDVFKYLLSCLLFTAIYLCLSFPFPLYVWRAFTVTECWVAFYSIMAMCLVFGGGHRLLKAGVSWADDCVRGPLEEKTPVPWSRRGVREGAPILLTGLLVLPYFLGALHVYRPKVSNIVNPGMHPVPGRVYETVEFTASDGLVLRGWFVPSKVASSERALLVCHGRGGSRMNVLEYLKLADALDASCLLFDFRGHGESDGRFTTYGRLERLDVLAAIDYLRTKRTERSREIIGLAISMGTAGLIPAAAAADPPLDALVLDSGFSSTDEMSDAILDRLPGVMGPWLKTAGVPIANWHVGLDLLEESSMDFVADVRAPTLFVHAEADAMVPVELGEKLYAAASQPKELWITTAPKHCGTFLDPELRKEYVRRVKGLLASSVAPDSPSVDAVSQTATQAGVTRSQDKDRDSIATRGTTKID